MILVDANLLLYAEDQASPQHAIARAWWDAQLSAAAPVCLCWPVLNAFLRIATNRRVLTVPLSIDQAIVRVQRWLNQPCVRIVVATQSHWDIFRKLLLEGQAAANLVNDAHLAALAIEYGCELYSSDADFSRFPSLKWRNPLTPSAP